LLLLSGRLGDVYGGRRCFLLGIALFTIGSLVCGLATWRALFLLARVAQGIGGAFISSASSLLILTSFSDPTKRARAFGILATVSFGGQSIALLLGGILTSAFNWRWIFLINLPFGAAIFVFGLLFLSDGIARPKKRELDVGGAVTVTVSLLLALHAIVNSQDTTRFPGETPALLAASVVTLAIFFVIESRVSAPLVPLRLFSVPNLLVANVVAMLMAAAMFSWGFTSTSYMQFVLRYSPLHYALAFVPASVATAALSLGPSAALVSRFGIRSTLTAELILIALGLAVFLRVPPSGAAELNVVSGMVLVGAGIGVASTPLALAVVFGVESADSGIASGIAATASIMGGLIGLGINDTVATACAAHLRLSGWTSQTALTSGYHAAFFLGALFAAAAALFSGTLMTRQTLKDAAHPQ
jgi:hypothetical protein